MERIRFKGWVSSNAIERGTPKYHLYDNSKKLMSMEGASNGAKEWECHVQRMMEWVLRDIDNADPYVDDIIIRSTGKTWEEVLINHQQDV